MKHTRTLATLAAGAFACTAAFAQISGSPQQLGGQPSVPVQQDRAYIVNTPPGVIVTPANAAAATAPAPMAPAPSSDTSVSGGPAGVQGTSGATVLPASTYLVVDRDVVSVPTTPIGEASSYISNAR